MENEYSKSFYKIRDVSEFTGLPQSTLRFWEKEFPREVAPIRNAGNIRYYTPDVIDNIRMIKYLLHERGMKIEAVKKELRLNRNNVSRRIKIMDTLTEIRNELTALLKSIEKRR